MFDVNAEDIAGLNDEKLRALVGRLCEAEVVRRGFSSSAVMWGGSQDAADGGLDVRVALPPGSSIDGYIPRAITGFQVKKPDLPPQAIKKEMRPKGIVRPVIADLANQSGAYIIVSSASFTSGAMYDRRRDAMVEAVATLGNPDDLFLDFYDRNRIASWVREHSGVVLWVRQAVGRAITGWQPYGPWAFAPEGVGGVYLLDDQVRIHTGRQEDGEHGLSAVDGIQRIRSLASRPGNLLRLIGLSGVGKTRLVQSLFDARIGENSLDPSLAHYTNLEDEPDPHPVALATNLVATRKRAILIIDNCPSALHQRLGEICRRAESTIGVITIEYDIRDDEPEGTDVIRVEPASTDLIKKLLDHRFPAISDVNVQTIAEFSGGNARIAIALAGRIDRDESIAGLSDHELFRRLFQQAHAPDDSLMTAAQACALVYSFQGDDISDGGEAELIRLGALVGKAAGEMYGHVAELRRRDLVQQRGVWKAILPHAIANRLAATALQNIPGANINAQLVAGAPARLLRSFSRRLGYLHESEQARALAEGWLAPDGMLGDVGNLNELGQAMLENVAPVTPTAALSALERAMLGGGAEQESSECKRYTQLIRKLAYDGPLFDRCSALLIKQAEAEKIGNASNDAESSLVSLFHIIYSGTHATVEQRIAVAGSLVESDNPLRQRIGFRALQALLEARNFMTHYNFDFGARSRNEGYWPRSRAETVHWFKSTLAFAERIACSPEPLRSPARAALADQFRSLWTCAGIYEELEHACDAIARHRFWREGWIAVRHTLHFDAKSFPPEVLARLVALEQRLGPKNLVQRVRGIVLARTLMGIVFDIAEIDDDGENMSDYGVARIPVLARSLGMSVAIDRQAFEELLPELFCTDALNLLAFGEGLLEGTLDHMETWCRLLTQFAVRTDIPQSIAVLCGYLIAMVRKYPESAAGILESLVEHTTLAPWFPILQTSVGIDEAGVARLLRSLELGVSSIAVYRNLALGRCTDPISGPDFRRLILTIASKPDGCLVALHILHMRLYSDREQRRSIAPDIIVAGRELLETLPLTRGNVNENYYLELVARICLAGPDGIAIADSLIRRFKESVGKYVTLVSEHSHLLDGIIAVQPYAFLDGLFTGDRTDVMRSIQLFRGLDLLQRNPIDGVPQSPLLAWGSREPARRYNVMAAIIRPFSRVGDDGPATWTPIALHILSRAPDRIGVLRNYVRQFRPQSWSGERSAILESNGKLLYDLAHYPDRAVVEFITQEKALLQKELEEERLSESLQNKKQDQRFE